MRYIFYPPIFSTAEQTERATTLFALVWLSIALAIGAFAALFGTQSNLFGGAFMPLLVLAPIGLVILELNRRGWTRFSSWLFIVTVVALASFRALASGGIRSPGVTMFYVFALAGGLLLGDGVGIAVGVVCAIIGLGLVLAEEQGLLPAQTIQYDAFTLWWINIISIGLTLFLLHRASRSLRNAFHSAQIELTERRKAQAEAIAVKTQLETLIAEARVGIVVFYNFKAAVANRELARILGYSNEIEILGVDDIRVFFAQEEQLRITKLAQGRLKGEDTREAVRLKCRRKDGSLIDIESRSFPVEWNGEKSICSMVTDVTEELQLEARLRQSQKLEAVGQMTGGIAHDFNNLLTVILGNASFLESRLVQDGLLRDMAALITRAAERGTNLTQKLLAFSRNQNLDLKVVDINAVASGMETLLRSAVGSDIQVELPGTAGSYFARADIPELENALLNLAVNARDAMADGGTLRIEIKDVELDTQRLAALGLEPGTPAGSFVLIAVSDTGTGMDEKTLSQAFDPFFTTKDVGKGSGLGLSMVYGFIKQLEGHIRIESEPARGTTVELYLPRGTPPEAQDEPLREAADIRGGEERILVVEDNDLVRMQVTMHLMSLGYDAVAAKDGIEALEVLRTGPEFDLLFTDIVMPHGINGVDLAKRAQALYPRLPVLFTSGYAEGIIPRHDKSMDLVSKPYRPNELAERIRNVLDRANSAACS
jgi:PAS domain S-box-containing protein